MKIQKQLLLLSIALFINTVCLGQISFEARVNLAYEKSFNSGENHIKDLIKDLEHEFSKDKNLRDAHFIAYAHYRESSFLKDRDESKAFDTLKKGISLLQAEKNKNSNDYALLGLMTSYSIVFQYEIAAIISSKATKYYEKCLELNPNNFRGYLGLGKSDLFRPVRYGGGLKVEGYLKKALLLLNKKNNSSEDLQWGKFEVYYYLTSYYIKSNKISEAKVYGNQGLKKFPKNKRLISLLEKIK
ncbi:hypothetical protein [Tenacibaculum xiamenense]|uniref:hypothetical protein n=1 Tax=Tenacibaculum xiamenense TaxID=1261553 RepID=UPI0038948920